MDVEVAASKWLKSSTLCYWPTLTMVKADTAVRDCVDPDPETWSLLEMTVIVDSSKHLQSFFVLL